MNGPLDEAAGATDENCCRLERVLATLAAWADEADDAVRDATDERDRELTEAKVCELTLEN